MISTALVRLIVWYSIIIFVAVTGRGKVVLKDYFWETSIDKSQTFYQSDQLFFISARSTSCTLLTYRVTLLTVLNPLASCTLKLKLLS